MKPFHLSFVVPDLNKAKDFYLNILGCELGRDTGEWIDIIFFEHQLTLHQERDGKPAVAIDHFGALLEKNQWLRIIETLSVNEIDFQLTPTIREEGRDTESGKYVIKDPAGNLLELKYYKQFSATVAGKDC